MGNRPRAPAPAGRDVKATSDISGNTGASRSTPPTAVFAFQSGGFSVKGYGWSHYAKLEIIETATGQITRIEGHPGGLQWLSGDLSYHMARWRDWWDCRPETVDGAHRGFHRRDVPVSKPCGRCPQERRACVVCPDLKRAGG